MYYGALVATSHRQACMHTDYLSLATLRCFLGSVSRFGRRSRKITRCSGIHGYI
jgi:hypothetical protein